jgi:serine/threonine protein kinase, bacterial
MSIDLYPIIKQIEDDKSGSTYLATNTLMPSRPYCIVKKLAFEHIDPSLQRGVWEEFQKESLILKSLGEESNGTIPKIYTYFAKGDGLYLVQEYISGQNLLDRVKSSGLFTEILVKQLLTEILPTLTYVHSRGMVHRDIKPSNIILREGSEEPTLIGFEAVKAKRSIMIGTPGFMPAEQVSGRPMFVSDIYSLGLTAIYLLTGKMPEELETNPSTGNINWQVFAPNVSQQLVDILNVAISCNPHDRYVNASEMLKALRSNMEVDSLVQLSTFNQKIQVDSMPQLFSVNPTLQYNYAPATKKNPQQSQFWDKADRMAVMIAGGVALGSAIAQLPGAIVGGMIAAGYAWYIRLS